MLYEIRGDILKAPTYYIAHQCNCTSRYGLGLYKSITNKWPSTNIYGTMARNPGEVIVTEHVIHMMGQRHKGRPNDRDDQTWMRHRWFKECLDKIANIKDVKGVSFPHEIGCGMARGNWKVYYNMIKEFSEENPNIQVYILNHKI